MCYSPVQTTTNPAHAKRVLKACISGLAFFVSIGKLKAKKHQIAHKTWRKEGRNVLYEVLRIDVSTNDRAGLAANEVDGTNGAALCVGNKNL